MKIEEKMLSKILGLLNKIVYKLKCGNKVSFSGIPRFVSHMQIYVESGKVEVGKSFSMKELILRPLMVVKLPLAIMLLLVRDQ
jgi:hypothetical protein